MSSFAISSPTTLRSCTRGFGSAGCHGPGNDGERRARSRMQRSTRSAVPSGALYLAWDWHVIAPDPIVGVVPPPLDGDHRPGGDAHRILPEVAQRLAARHPPRVLQLRRSLDPGYALELHDQRLGRPDGQAAAEEVAIGGPDAAVEGQR